MKLIVKNKRFWNKRLHHELMYYYFNHNAYFIVKNKKYIGAYVFKCKKCKETIEFIRHLNCNKTTSQNILKWEERIIKQIIE